GNELLDLPCVAHLRARLVKQTCGGCVPNAHHDAVADDRFASYPDRGHAAASVCLFDELPGAQVDDGGDFDAAPGKVLGRAIAVRVRGEHDDAVEGLDCIAMDQALRGR